MKSISSSLAILLFTSTGLAQTVLPTVYVNSGSAGNNWKAFRDQSQEMTKDFEKDCPGIRLTADNQRAAYVVRLSHIEAGLILRDNQFSVSDFVGNVVASRELGSINEGVKLLCGVIISDWNDAPVMRDKLVNFINTGFQRDKLEGYAEYTDGSLIIHTTQATSMRFHMLIHSNELAFAKQAGIKTMRYTNDADQDFTYEFAAAKITTTDTNSAGSDAPRPFGESIRW